MTPEEIRHLRKLGVTKVQIGVQSLDDEILVLNKRGHDVEAVRHALGLLRTAGFKLHLHWMPNLFGATPEKDRDDFARFYTVELANNKRTFVRIYLRRYMGRKSSSTCERQF